MTAESSTYSYLTPGQKLGKYEIKSLIGRGGMAEVYRARNPDLNQDVAIKFLRPQIVDSPEQLARFQQEARAAAALNHPHILRVYDFDTTGPAPYMVMELIEGPTLRDLIAHHPGRLPIERAIKLFAQVAEAVGYAHARGIIHRDIKPGNVLIAPGDRALLTDFGLARILGGSRLTTSEVSLGTPAYMSPEQAAGLDTNKSTDIYALGVLFFEMVTGDVPFQGGSFAQVLVKHLNQPPAVPSQLRDDLPPEVDSTILRALEKDPASRFQSAKEILESLGLRQDGDSTRFDNPNGGIRTTGEARTVAMSPPTGVSPTVQSGDSSKISRLSLAVSAIEKRPVLTISAILLIAVVIIAIGLIAVVLTLTNRSAEVASVNTPAPPTATLFPLPEGMVYIPAGDLNMGSANYDKSEAPVHKVTLHPFLIDKTEVTNQDYLRFVLDQNYAAPAAWSNPDRGPWEFTATQGVDIGTEEERYSYDGKLTSVIDGSIKASLDSDKDAGQIEGEFTGTLTPRKGDTRTGKWRFVHNSFRDDQAFYAGGVAEGVSMHGNTGREGSFYPTLTSALSTWGYGTLYFDDQVYAENVGFHTMLTQGIRSPNNEILKTEDKCCYTGKPADGYTGYLDPNTQQLMIIMFTSGNYDAPASDTSASNPDSYGDDYGDEYGSQPAAGSNNQSNLWIELTFKTVELTRKPEGAGGVTFPPDTALHPVTTVTWNDAAAYCEWRSKRLPTEAEWERAARGDRNTIFPWGTNEQVENVIPANWDSGALMPVGSFPAGASSFGLLDMGGNAWEWVSDHYDAGWYGKNNGNVNPTGPLTGVARVLRGGGYKQLNGEGAFEFRTTIRLARLPTTSDPAFGFRCVRDVE